MCSQCTYEIKHEIQKFVKTLNYLSIVYQFNQFLGRMTVTDNNKSNSNKWVSKFPQRHVTRRKIKVQQLTK